MHRLGRGEERVTISSLAAQRKDHGLGRSEWGEGTDTHTGSTTPVGCSDTHSGPACSPRDTRPAPRRQPAPTPHPQRGSVARRGAAGLGGVRGPEKAAGRQGAGEQRGRPAGGGGPFKRGGGGTMAIITLALEVTPGPLRFHLGRGRGDGPLPGGGGEGGGRRGGRGRPGLARPGPSRLGPAPHAASRSRGSVRGWHRGGGSGGSAPLPAAALKGAGAAEGPGGARPVEPGECGAGPGCRRVCGSPPSLLNPDPAGCPAAAGTFPAGASSRPAPRWRHRRPVPYSGGCSSLCLPGRGERPPVLPAGRRAVPVAGAAAFG